MADDQNQNKIQITRISFHIPEELATRFRELCQAEYTSMSEQLRRQVIRWVREKNEEQRS